MLPRPRHPVMIRRPVTTCRRRRPAMTTWHGAAITAGFEFDVPVRFDTDYLEVDLSHFEAGQIPNIPIVEIRI